MSVTLKKIIIFTVFLLVLILAGFFIFNSKETLYTSDYSMDKDFVHSILKRFTKSSHEFGSKNQKDLKNYILDTLTGISSFSYSQGFYTRVPLHGSPDSHRYVDGYNIIAKSKTAHSHPCTVLVGSHYDTKVLSSSADSFCPGANDSGSSSAVLLDFLRYLSKREDLSTRCSLSFVWFDGEESVLEGWDEWKNYSDIAQDNTYGSRYFVSRLEGCSNSNKKYSGYCLNGIKSQSEVSSQDKEEIVAFVLIDMVGSGSIQLSRDSNSDLKLQSIFSNMWYSTYKQAIFNDQYQDIEDDHIPFIKKKIKSIDLIDFNHLDYWHTPEDKLENISLEDLSKFSKVAIEYIVWLADHPDAIYK